MTSEVNITTEYQENFPLVMEITVRQGCGGWVVRALFYDASYQYLGYTNAASGNQPGSSYAQVGSRVTTPARTAWIKVSLQLYLSVGWVSFDDVSLKRVTLESSTQYYYAGGQRVARRVNGGSLQYLFGDHLGSAALVTDSSFTKISELRYNAWGKRRYTDGTAPAENAFTYTGQRQEADLGLMFYNARWYDSELGRFVQADTIIPDPGNPIGWDRYAYVNNSPIRYADPSGRFTEDQVTDYLKERYNDLWGEYLLAWKNDKTFWNMLMKANYGYTLDAPTTCLGKGLFTMAGKSFGFRNFQDIDNLYEYQGYGPYVLNGNDEFQNMEVHIADEGWQTISTIIDQPIYQYSANSGPVYTGFHRQVKYQWSGQHFNPLSGDDTPGIVTGVGTVISAYKIPVIGPVISGLIGAYSALTVLNNFFSIEYSLTVSFIDRAEYLNSQGPCITTPGSICNPHPARNYLQYVK